jgi:hypothetical protein
LRLRIGVAASVVAAPASATTTRMRGDMTGGLCGM